ncbi:MAG: hypothetical protein WD335_00450 [Candidatus Paceibacterota bacterium]
MKEVIGILGAFTLGTWIFLGLQFSSYTGEPELITLFVASRVAYASTAITLFVTMIWAIFGISSAAGKEAINVWDDMSPKEKGCLKNYTKKKAHRANEEYRNVRDGNKDKVSAVIDWFFN